MFRWISKSGTFIQFTIFIVFLTALWIPSFVHPLPPVQTPADGPLYKLLVSLIQSFPALTVALALLLIVLQSFILFYVYQANGFFGRSNFVPAILILLAYSWNPDFQTMHALLPAGIFIILALNATMRMYGKQAAYHQVFTAAFSLGIASLFYLPLAYLFLMIWFTLITYRISGWREYAVTIIGYVLPFIYYVSWLYWSDSMVTGLRQLSGSLFNFVLPARITLVNTVWLSVSAFIMAVSMLTVLSLMNDKLISVRRRAWVLFNFSLTALIIVLLA
ncbi:MAG: hypothetical protein WCR72_09425 [Bacteroidota bacterium]